MNNDLNTYFHELLQNVNTIDSKNRITTQAAARYILQQYDIPKRQYPNYSYNLDNDINNYIFVALQIAINLPDEEDETKHLFDKVGGIIEHTYAKNEKNTQRGYYLLLGALSYYCASQYSKAFLLMQKSSKIGSFDAWLIGLLLKKDFASLEQTFRRYLCVDKKDVDNETMASKIMLSKSISCAAKYLLYGDSSYIQQAKDILSNIIHLAELNCSTAEWWIYVLLSKIFSGFENNVLWSVFAEEMLGQDENVYQTYIHSLLYQKHTVTELFPTQIQALPFLRSEKGCVISLPTSSGKTRIAEIAIIKQIQDDAQSKVLYLAPFRSLAYEVEDSFSHTLEKVGAVVSHLYGGNLFSVIDQSKFDISNVIIATPEKAKAIYRINEDLFNSVKLIILDEGHFLGLSDRCTRYEMFVEELKVLCRRNNAKIMLLSAVLPNAESIQKWVTKSEDTLLAKTWRLASQKCGWLIHSKTSGGYEFDINWINKEGLFNKHFMQCASQPKTAVAQIAYRLSSTGAVLIFAGKTAEANALAGELNQIVLEDANWGNSAEWKRFEITCQENDPDGHILNWAKKGILCHDGKLPAEVRLAMETLLHKGIAKYIVATTTLAQGVNIGVSTVIFYTTNFGNGYLSKRDFWNIAGRAGRAFIDTEGTILYYIEDYVYDNHEKYVWRWKAVEKYFDPSNIEMAMSGVLLLINNLFTIAAHCHIDEETLLDLVANNQFNSTLFTDEIIKYFDYIDDSLLAIAKATNESKLDDTLREMLAYIQASTQDEKEFVYKVLKSRVQWVTSVSKDINHKKLSAAGVPLRDATKLLEQEQQYFDIIQDYTTKEVLSFDDYLQIVYKIEPILKELPTNSFTPKYKNFNDKYWKEWLLGYPLSKELQKHMNYLTYQIPWGLNAIATLFDDEVIKSIFSTLSIMCEIGVSSPFAAKIYQCGIRSRMAANNLSGILNEQDVDLSLNSLKSAIIENRNKIYQSPDCLEITKSWVHIFADLNKQKKEEFVRILPWSIEIKNTKISEDVRRLWVYQWQNKYYLCNETGEVRIHIKPNCDKPIIDEGMKFLGTYLARERNNKWILRSDNPNVEVL